MINKIRIEGIDYDIGSNSLTLDRISAIPDIMYELILKTNRNEISTNKVYVINGMYEATIYTNGSGYKVVINDIFNHICYRMNEYISVSSSLTSSAISYKTYEYQEKLIANGVCDDYAEPLERIEIDGKKYTTLNKKKVEYVTAHFEEGKFSHTFQDIADSSLPVFITNLTSGIEFELRHVYYNDRGYFVFIADGDLMDSITNYFDSLAIGGCYEKDSNYLDFIENTCCGEGDELKIEYYNHQSSVYREV